MLSHVAIITLKGFIIQDIQPSVGSNVTVFYSCNISCIGPVNSTLKIQSNSNSFSGS